MFLAFSIISFTAVLVMALVLEQGRLNLVVLPELVIDESALPKISIVIPARNEATTIGAALQSVLSLDYPDFEVIVVNDRSTDDTNFVLLKMKEKFPHIVVLDVQELPPGWLGKNHALQVGSRRAVGDYVLFTDADVVFERSSLKQAVSYAVSNGRDHLCLLLKAWSRSWLMSTFIPYFGVNFLLYFRPWLAKDPKELKRFVGIGAFNLVRRSVLEKIGALQKIKLRPDDDVKLGKVIKRAGYSQECLAAPHALSVEWYPDFKSCLIGLEKNAFSGTDYRLAHSILGPLVNVLLSLLPIFGILFASGTAFWLCCMTLFLQTLTAIRGAYYMGSKPEMALAYPLAACLFAYVVIRATLKNIYQGGIYWRDTFYSLEELKKNLV